MGKIVNTILLGAALLGAGCRETSIHEPYKGPLALPPLRESTPNPGYKFGPAPMPVQRTQTQRDQCPVCTSSWHVL